MNKFPKGTSLRIELKTAINRLTTIGVDYPDGYSQKLLRKYSKKSIDYPRILMRLGEPNIKKHKMYKQILKMEGRLLDYGCGTGDDLRALIRDGYPRKKLKGYDVFWNCINLGFDFYLDKNEIKNMFRVSKKPRFKTASFDIVYSGSVLHTMEDIPKLKAYIHNANRILRHGGILFGSTLGTGRIKEREKRLTVLSRTELARILHECGFSHIDIDVLTNKPTDRPKKRLWFYAVKV
jgi:SAM-dependent methyltransferase